MKVLVSVYRTMLPQRKLLPSLSASKRRLFTFVEGISSNGPSIRQKFTFMRPGSFIAMQHSAFFGILNAIPDLAAAGAVAELAPREAQHIWPRLTYGLRQITRQCS